MLKEAFAAVPFRINPANVTGALDKTFQFRRGVLFQRFVIASGSFVASSESKSSFFLILKSLKGTVPLEIRVALADHYHHLRYSPYIGYGPGGNIM